MTLIIRTGFQEIDISIFRPKSISKGEKLVKSYHVSDVREMIDGDHREIRGSVLRETPGAASTRIKENVYFPEIELDQSNGRTIRCTRCTCKAGMLLCKHAAALCIYVNEENTLSKTDVPMTWNRPPELQLQKYRKGCTLDTLFPSAGNLTDRKVYRFSDVQNVTEIHREENRPLIHMLKAEEKCIDQKEERENLRKMQEAFNRELFSELFSLQTKNTFNAYDYRVKIINPNKQSEFRPISCPEKCASFYSDNIVVTEEDWIDICIASLHQSESAAWFQQRSMRITCSEKAHRIKTRQKNMESLALQLKNKSGSRITTKAMRYGLEMEHIAREFFAPYAQLPVHQTGLIINFKKPFMACSPDGVVLNDGLFELLEIKCPESCADSPIVDITNRKSYVKYLKFEEDGQIKLIKSHQYYTQVQVSMYVVCVKICHFFVFSKQQCVDVKIDRDEEFLSTLIPKIEKFYFEHFINLFQSDPDENVLEQ